MIALISMLSVSVLFNGIVLCEKGLNKHNEFEDIDTFDNCCAHIQNIVPELSQRST